MQICKYLQIIAKKCNDICKYANTCKKITMRLLLTRKMIGQYFFIESYRNLLRNKLLYL